MPAHHGTTPPTNNHFSYKPKGKLKYNPEADIVRDVHLPLVTGLSLTTIWRRRKAGQFPKPIQLGPHSNGTTRAVLQQWLAQRESASK
jgi:predicted DNA-binding transcriptional regulator AlpA